MTKNSLLGECSSASTTGDVSLSDQSITLSPGTKSAFRFTNLLTLSSTFSGFHQVLSLFSLYSDLCSLPLEEEVQKTRPGPEGRIPVGAATSKVVNLCGSTGRAGKPGLQAGTSQRDSGLIFLLFNHSGAETHCARGLPLSSMIQSNCDVIYMVSSRK